MEDPYPGAWNFNGNILVVNSYNCEKIVMMLSLVVEIHLSNSMHII